MISRQVLFKQIKTYVFMKNREIIRKELDLDGDDGQRT